MSDTNTVTAQCQTTSAMNKALSQSNAEAVKEFCENSRGPLPAKPTLMSKEAVFFITRMIISELDELACTVSSTEEERDTFLLEALEKRDKCKNYQSSYGSVEDIIAAQNDALVDAWYYSLDHAAKHGTNLSAIFDLVHQANMNKRDPLTGKFTIRESDGKIIKPPGWQSPDITQEIIRQRAYGAWNQ